MMACQDFSLNKPDLNLVFTLKEVKILSMGINCSFVSGVISLLVIEK